MRLPPPTPKPTLAGPPPPAPAQHAVGRAGRGGWPEAAGAARAAIGPRASFLCPPPPTIHKPFVRVQCVVRPPLAPQPAAGARLLYWRRAPRAAPGAAAGGAGPGALHARCHRRLLPSGPYYLGRPRPRGWRLAPPPCRLLHRYYLGCGALGLLIRSNLIRGSGHSFSGVFASRRQRHGARGTSSPRRPHSSFPPTRVPPRPRRGCAAPPRNRLARCLSHRLGPASRRGGCHQPLPRGGGGSARSVTPAPPVQSAPTLGACSTPQEREQQITLFACPRLDARRGTRPRRPAVWTKDAPVDKPPGSLRPPHTLGRHVLHDSLTHTHAHPAAPPRRLPVTGIARGRRRRC